MAEQLEKVALSLTAPSSHTLVRRPGVGSLAVGEAGPGFRPDLEVGASDRVDWAVLDGLTTPAGDPWPRRVVYRGEDAGVFDWTRRRATESLDFSATAPIELDASGSLLASLTVQSEGNPVRLRMPSAEVCRVLVLVGDPAAFDLLAHPDGSLPEVCFDLEPTVADDEVRQLPTMPALRASRRLQVRTPPLGAPFDVASLDQFEHVSTVRLRGAVTNLQALARMPLQTLELRFVPDLAGLPPLRTWPDLGHIVVFNCDATASRHLRTQLRSLPPSEKHRSVSQPRDRAWFLQEYGLPFGSWPPTRARLAVKAFREAAKNVRSARDEREVLAVVESFVRHANGFDGVETGEREDLAHAAVLLGALGPVRVAPDDVVERFDAVRDF